MKKRDKEEGLGSNTSEISSRSDCKYLGGCQVARNPCQGMSGGVCPLHKAESQS